jgi:ATP-dependent DNA helicase RecQ
MLEREQVELTLPETALSALAHAPGGALRSTSKGASQPAVPKVNTVEETYALYSQGLPIEEIATQRGLTVMTIEKHLAECIAQGRPFDLTRHVTDRDRALIETAAAELGTEQLRPLRDRLPPHINYRMIRFVIADMQRPVEEA